ncbi:MAG: HD domain-containing phosphohydrolase [Treponema sp.]|nr:HD domain-containing phosphohydrolase [Treponema sp.]
MDMDTDFFLFNKESINKLVTKVVLATNILPPLFVVLTMVGIFSIDDVFAGIVSAIVIPFSIIQLVVVYCFRRVHSYPKVDDASTFGYDSLAPVNKVDFDSREKICNGWQTLGQYTGLIGLSLIVAFLGTHAHVGIYIGYSLVTFLSCLYFNVRLTCLIGIIDYFLMIVSVYFKTTNKLKEGMPEIVARGVFDTSVAYIAGFTIEFVFVFMISYYISKRCYQALQEANGKNEQLKRTELQIMGFIPDMLKSHEVFTGYHIKHTVVYMDMICREVVRQGNYTDVLTKSEIELYSSAANLHDIGKIHIPDHILNKPGKFTDAEFEMMKRHPQEGKILLESLPKIRGGRFNEIAEQMAYYHHEKYGGGGYPTGLSGNLIPLCARLMAAADVLDALLSWRPYKEPWDIDRAIEEFEKQKNKQFEPCIADAVIALKPVIFMKSQEFLMDEQMTKELERESEWRNKLRQEQFQELYNSGLLNINK